MTIRSVFKEFPNLSPQGLKFLVSYSPKGEEEIDLLEECASRLKSPEREKVMKRVNRAREALWA